MTDHSSKLNWQKRFSTTSLVFFLNRKMIIATIRLKPASQFTLRFFHALAIIPSPQKRNTNGNGMRQPVSQFWQFGCCCCCCSPFCISQIYFFRLINFEWQKKGKHLFWVCNLFVLRARIKRPFSICLSFHFVFSLSREPFEYVCFYATVKFRLFFACDRARSSMCWQTHYVTRDRLQFAQSTKRNTIYGSCTFD